MNLIKNWAFRLGIMGAVFLNCGQNHPRGHTDEYMIFATDDVDSRDVIERHDLDDEMNLDSLDIAHVHSDVQTLDRLVESGELEGYVPFGGDSPPLRRFKRHIRIIDDDSRPIYQRTTQWTNQATRAQALAANNLSGEGIRIGIIDSGINPLIANYDVAAHYNFVDDRQYLHDTIGHGTFVAAIIHRLLPDAELYSYTAYRMHHGRGKTFVRDIVESIDQAIEDDVHVINMSLSLDSPIECEGMTWQDANRFLGEALQRAASHGILLVTSAGNNRSMEPLRRNWLPEGSPYVLSVGAYDRSGEIASFSDLDAYIFAPGRDVYSLHQRRTRRSPLRPAYNSGTSFSAPQVTVALAAIIEHERERGREITRDRAYAAITETGRRESSIVLSLQGRSTHHFRVLDYRRMIRRLQEQ